MTDTTTTVVTDRLERVVPRGCDPLDDLTCGELGHVGRLLKADPYAAVTDKTLGLRWPALAHLAWVWSKRTDPHAKLDPILQLRPAQVSQLLGLDDDDDTDDGTQDVAENPTDSAPAS